MQIKQIKVGFHANWQWVLCKWVDNATTRSMPMLVKEKRSITQSQYSRDFAADITNKAHQVAALRSMQVRQLASAVCLTLSRSLKTVGQHRRDSLKTL